MGSSCAVAAMMTRSAVAVAVVLLVAAAAAAAVDKHCFHACFDQCVPRNEFWFCQFSCYDKCGHAGSGAGHVAGAGDLDCEHSCILSLCGQLDPGSKMMVACRDTCRQHYASAGCRSGIWN